MTFLLGLLLFGFAFHQIRQYQNAKLQTFDCSLNHIGILVTGCDTGIGHSLVISLNKFGYCVIASCYTDNGINKLNNDPTFTKHGSFAFKMDISDLDSIKNGKNIISNWLSKDKSNIFWSVVNNAAICNLTPFEIVPHSMMMYEYNVLFFGPINVTRIMLPLLYGRRCSDCKRARDGGDYINNYNYDGGRIINVSSGARMMPCQGFTRYGASKAGLSYFTHCLRAEYANTFGIWCSVIEPGAYKTEGMNITQGFVNKIRDYYYDKNDKLKIDTLTNEEEEICNTFIIPKPEQVNKMKESKKFSNDLTPVVDSIIHAITSKYPQRLYQPGVPPLTNRIIALLPFFVREKIGQQVIKDQKLPVKVSRVCK